LNRGGDFNGKGFKNKLKNLVLKFGSLKEKKDLCRPKRTAGSLERKIEVLVFKLLLVVLI
jgi:hypothetical protein